MAQSLPARFRQACNRMLNPLGLHLQRCSRACEMDGLLARASARAGSIRTWIDVGASDGSWSVLAQRHFPNAGFLLFEPLEERQPALQKLRESRGFSVVAAAAGATPGKISFQIDPGLDGSGVAADTSAGTRQVPVDTIDRALLAAGLPGPYGIKLDTHGYELPVLEGAAATLPQTQLLIVEAYNFTLAPGSLRFHELCAWMEARGFRCCDLADPMRRPRDGALWQMDLAFAPASSPLFLANTYD